MSLMEEIKEIAFRQLLDVDMSKDMERLQRQYGKEAVAVQVEKSGFSIILKKYQQGEQNNGTDDNI